MAIGYKRYVKCLAASGLMSAAELAAFEAELPPSKRPRDAQQLARALVRAGKLTRYQAATLYQGKSQDLVLGNYLVLDRIGGGGMGEVFKALHRRMDRVVALKLLPPASGRAANALERFHREVKAAAKLSHPNIVTAHDADEAAGRHFLVMEYIDGPNLAQVLRDHGPLPAADAVALVMQAARGLAHAHELGIVHRDVKPGNLLVDSSGTLKILDMGLARIHSQLEGAARTEQTITGSGQVVGTIEYMAPEQAEATRQADHRADIYGLGCTLFRLLTGEQLYPGETPVQIVVAHREAPIPSIHERRSDVPAGVDSIFRKMVAKKPADRYQSMTAVLEAFAALGFAESPVRSFASPHPETSSSTTAPAGSRPSSGWALWAAAAAVIAAAVLAARPGDQPSATEVQDGAGLEHAFPLSAGEARLLQEQWSGRTGSPIVLVNSLEMRLVLIPPGQFLMGSTRTQLERVAGEGREFAAPIPVLSERLASECAQHPVRISRPFYLAAHEVTVHNFQQFLQETNSASAESSAGGRVPDEGGNHPAAGVTWHQAAAFCQWLSARESAAYRLPTEAEWEYACRAGSDSLWWFGNGAASPGRRAWYGLNSGNRTHLVGLLEPNAFGLFDLCGNVREWCFDGPRRYSERAVVDPQGSFEGPRVQRGGDWSTATVGPLRSAARHWAEPHERHPAAGFRVLREVGH